MMSRGVIYIATGQKYIDEAINSANSLKSQIPEISITIFSDKKISNSIFERSIIIREPKYDFEDKILYISKSPYQHSLFLDTDTYICADFSEIFLLLNKFDLAVAHAPIRKVYPLKEIPNSFPEMNTGVILFNNSPEIEKLFVDWLNLYRKKKKKSYHDQPSFRKALYNSNIRIATLTPEYNCRFTMIPFVYDEVKILHGRHPNLSKLALKINSKLRHRVIKDPNEFVENIMLYRGQSDSLKSLFNRLIRTLFNRLLIKIR